jgi:hypothetical protein
MHQQPEHRRRLDVYFHSRGLQGTDMGEVLQSLQFARPFYHKPRLDHRFQAPLYSGPRGPAQSTHPAGLINSRDEFPRSPFPCASVICLSPHFSSGQPFVPARKQNNAGFVPRRTRYHPPHQRQASSAAPDRRCEIAVAQPQRAVVSPNEAPTALVRVCHHVTAPRPLASSKKARSKLKPRKLIHNRRLRLQC